MEFLQQLDEARILRNTTSLDKMQPEDVVGLAILELSNLVMFQQDPQVRQYAKQTMEGGYNRWMMNGTDLHNAITALNSPEYRKKLGVKRGTPNVPLLQKILRDASQGKATATDYNKFTMNLQRDFGVSNTFLMSIRRRVADFGLLNKQQQTQLGNDINRAYTSHLGSPWANSDVAKLKQTKKSSVLRSLGKWAAVTTAVGIAGYYLGKSLIGNKE